MQVDVLFNQCLNFFYVPCAAIQGQRHEYRRGARFSRIDLLGLGRLRLMERCLDYRLESG